MDSSVLVASAERDSRELLNRLDAARVPIVGAYLYWDPEPESGRLLLVSPGVEEEGSLRLYEAIQKSLRAHPPLALDLSDITVKAPWAELVQTLSRTVAGPASALSVASVARGLNGLVYNVVALRPLQDAAKSLSPADHAKRARRAARST